MVHSLGLMVPVIVAGGLNAANVSEAMELFQPFGVDVVSGVEARPGKKDPRKVRDFVHTVREAEKRA
jgi:phosphoribosylanthranilate isomerase